MRVTAKLTVPRSFFSLCCRVIELVLPGAAEAGLNAAVLPQPLDHSGQLAGHEALLCRTGKNKQLPSIILQRHPFKKNVTFSLQFIQILQER